MSILSKICLGIAIFLGCGLSAYAAFNYDSSRNYFYIDSILKTGGNYIIVGDALSGYCSDRQYPSENECLAAGKDWQEKLSKIDSDGNVSESSQFFAVSNNLIFTPQARFLSGVRQIAKNTLNNKFEFKTNAITLSGNNNLEIITMGNNRTLEISPDLGSNINVKMNQDLNVSGGISFFANTIPEEKNIYVAKVLTKDLTTLDDSLVPVKDGTVITAAPQVEAANIYFGTTTQPLCYKMTVTAGDMAWDGASVEYLAGQYLGSHPTMPQRDCRQNYYIYDAKITDKGDGVFICCRIDSDQSK